MRRGARLEPAHPAHRARSGGRPRHQATGPGDLAAPGPKPRRARRPPAHPRPPPGARRGALRGRHQLQPRSGLRRRQQPRQPRDRRPRLRAHRGARLPPRRRGHRGAPRRRGARLRQALPRARRHRDRQPPRAPGAAHDLARLEAIELAPFRAALAAGVDAVMTAHVRFDALDPTVPATLSRAVMTTLLRDGLAARSDAVVVSDDLLMRAVSDRWTVEESAPLAIAAGCDLLLVCSDPDAQERARLSLASLSRTDPAFADRLRDAASRVSRLRERLVPRIVRAEALPALWQRPSRLVLEARLDALRSAPGGAVDPTERS
nr:hypothetical protein [Deltaproteobacteria bacterium]